MTVMGEQVTVMSVMVRSRLPKVYKLQLTTNKTGDAANYNSQEPEEGGSAGRGGLLCVRQNKLLAHSLFLTMNRFTDETELQHWREPVSHWEPVRGRTLAVARRGRARTKTEAARANILNLL